ncbi:MAG: alpha/beta hydrolase [Bacteroidota bacterium]
MGNPTQEKNPPRAIQWITHVGVPTLEVFIPSEKTATGQAVLICPGGGYFGVAYDWEGTDVAKWLNGYGVAAFVLKYRMPYVASVDVDHLAPIQDAVRAMQLIRFHSKKWNLDSTKIGVMGFSAGGHLASTLGTNWEQGVTSVDDIGKVDPRPNFMALIYPVISMKEEVTHAGSRKHLLGEHPSDKLILQYSNELQVTKDTPPTFLVHSQNDEGVPIENSLLFYQALTEVGVPSSMHLYPSGGHGYGLARSKDLIGDWPDQFISWIDDL